MIDGARVHVDGDVNAADMAKVTEVLRAGVAEVRRRATMKPERCGPTTNTDTLRLCSCCRKRSTFQAHGVCSECRAGGAP